MIDRCIRNILQEAVLIKIETKTVYTQEDFIVELLFFCLWR